MMKSYMYSITYSIDIDIVTVLPSEYGIGNFTEWLTQ